MSDYERNDKDEFVKAELGRFVRKHTGLDALSSIDEIVLSYIISVLESLDYVSSAEDAFDVDEFIEVMGAYIPSFSNIHSSYVYAWMVNLAELLKRDSKKKEESNSLEDILFKTTKQDIDAVNCKCGVANCSHPIVSRRRSSYYTSNSCSSSQSEDDEKCINVSGYENEGLETLTEMFPNLHILEAKQFLNMSEGDCERAVQLILQKQEEGEDVCSYIISKNATQFAANPCKEKFVEDKQLREQILNRYAYIDQTDDIREHKPIAPRNEPKKLIRYRDNKIVSIKGERYSEIKKKKEMAQSDLK